MMDVSRRIEAKCNSVYKELALFYQKYDPGKLEDVNAISKLVDFIMKNGTDALNQSLVAKYGQGIASYDDLDIGMNENFEDTAHALNLKIEVLNWNKVFSKLHAFYHKYDKNKITTGEDIGSIATFALTQGIDKLNDALQTKYRSNLLEFWDKDDFESFRQNKYFFPEEKKSEQPNPMMRNILQRMEEKLTQLERAQAEKAHDIEKIESEHQQLVEELVREDCSVSVASTEYSDCDTNDSACTSDDGGSSICDLRDSLYYDLARFYSNYDATKLRDYESIGRVISFAINNGIDELNVLLSNKYGDCLDSIPVADDDFDEENLADDEILRRNYIHAELYYHYQKCDPAKLEDDLEDLVTFVSGNGARTLSQYFKERYGEGFSDSMIANLEIEEEEEEETIDIFIRLEKHLQEFYAKHDKSKKNDKKYIEDNISFATEFGIDVLNESLYQKYGKKIDLEEMMQPTGTASKNDEMHSILEQLENNHTMVKGARSDLDNCDDVQDYHSYWNDEYYEQVDYEQMNQNWENYYGSTESCSELTKRRIRFSEEDIWVCKQCSYENAHGFNFCGKCRRKDDTYATYIDPSASYKDRRFLWLCTCCSKWNQSSSQACGNCRANRPLTMERRTSATYFPRSRTAYFLTEESPQNVLDEMLFYEEGSFKHIKKQSNSDKKLSSKKHLGRHSETTPEEKEKKEGPSLSSAFKISQKLFKDLIKKTNGRNVSNDALMKALAEEKNVTKVKQGINNLNCLKKPKHTTGNYGSVPLEQQKDKEKINEVKSLIRSFDSGCLNINKNSIKPY